MLFRLLSALLVLAFVLVTPSHANCVPCDQTTRLPLPSGSTCCTLPHHGTGTVKYNAAMCGTVINLQTLANSTCWSTGTTPDHTSILVIAGFTGITLTTFDANTNITHLQSLRGLVVSAGASLVLQNARVETVVGVSVLGTLSMQTTIPAMWYNAAPPESFMPNPNNVNRGIYDCATLTGGFNTTRLCGTGIVSVFPGGVYNATSHAVFANVEVQSSGAVVLESGAFLFSVLVNNGNVTMAGSPSYPLGMYFLHGEVHNLASGSIVVFGSFVFDGWTWHNPSTPEMFRGTTITNEGLLVLGGISTVGSNQQWAVPANSTNYYSYNYECKVENKVGGTIRHVGSSLDAGLDMNDWNVKNYGVYEFHQTSTVNVKDTFYNYGNMTVDGAQVWAWDLHSVGGNVILLNGGTLNGASGRSSRRSRSSQPEASSSTHPIVHLGDGDLFCPYGDANCCDCATPGSDCHAAGACYQMSICYACTSSGMFRPSGELGSEEMRASLLSNLPRQSRDKILAAKSEHREHPKRVMHTHTFSNTMVSGDGTGSLVISSPITASNLTILNASLVSVVEYGLSPFLGGGDVVIGSGGALYLGVDAALSEGGRITVRRGGSVVVEGHSEIRFRNHTLSLQRGAELRVDGTVRFDGEYGVLRTCGGRSTGKGHVVLSLEQAGAMAKGPMC